MEANLLSENRLIGLLNEIKELTSIFTAIGNTIKLNLINSKSEIPIPKFERNSKLKV
jgi:hypothetical protein